TPMRRFMNYQCLDYVSSVMKNLRGNYFRSSNLAGLHAKCYSPQFPWYLVVHGLVDLQALIS
ncbi:MAG TPA: hypothetical protein VGR15_03505, partial [Bacteroidota bacterium]|nr:hypothetical protein [Bacteroidota bacterium]